MRQDHQSAGNGATPDQLGATGSAAAATLAGSADAFARLAGAAQLFNCIADLLGVATDELCEAIAEGSLERAVTVQSMLREAGALADDAAQACGTSRTRDDWRTPAARWALDALTRGRSAEEVRP